MGSSKAPINTTKTEHLTENCPMHLMDTENAPSVVGGTIGVVQRGGGILNRCKSIDAPKVPGLGEAADV